LRTWTGPFRAYLTGATAAVTRSKRLNSVCVRRSPAKCGVEGGRAYSARRAGWSGLTFYPSSLTLPAVGCAEEIIEALEEARKLRRERADWEFIEKLSPKLKAALKYYVETGDIYVASRIAGLTVDEFNELRVRARVPSVT